MEGEDLAGMYYSYQSSRVQSVYCWIWLVAVGLSENFVYIETNSSKFECSGYV
jgi:hypothetical protein